MSQRPTSSLSLRHVALFSQNLEESVKFYTHILGMQLVWKPDNDNYYLSTGSDNFALHRAAKNFDAAQDQRLDHIGFFLNERDEVDLWYEYLSQLQVKIIAPPKDHRDGTRSMYCADPDGTVIQLIYYPIENR